MNETNRTRQHFDRLHFCLVECFLECLSKVRLLGNEDDNSSSNTPHTHTHYTHTNTIAVTSPPAAQ